MSALNPLTATIGPVADFCRGWKPDRRIRRKDVGWGSVGASVFHKPHAGGHHGRPRPVNEGEACHMSELTIWTLDWVPAGPRGFVRDLRLRWACEEAGLA